MDAATAVLITLGALAAAGLLILAAVIAGKKKEPKKQAQDPLLDRDATRDGPYGAQPEPQYQPPPPAEPAPAAYANVGADPVGNASGQGGGYGGGGPAPEQYYAQPSPQGQGQHAPQQEQYIAPQPQAAHPADAYQHYSPEHPPQHDQYVGHGVEQEGLHFQMLSLTRYDERSAPGTELYRSLAVRVRAFDVDGQIVGEEVSWPFVMLQPPSEKLWWGTTRYMKCSLADVDFLEIMVVAPAEHELRHSKQGGVHLYSHGSVRMAEFLKYLPYGSTTLTEKVVLQVPLLAVDPVDAGLEVLATVALQPSPEIRKTICLWKLPGEIPNDPPGLSSASRNVVNEMYHELNDKVHDTALKDITTIYSCPSIAGVQCGMCYLAPMLRHAGVAGFDNRVTISRYSDPDAKFKKGMSVEEFAHLLRSRTEQLFSDVSGSIVEFLGEEKALLDASSLFSVRTGLTWVDPRYPQAARNDATAEFFNQIAYTPGGMCLVLSPTASYEFLQRYLTHDIPLEERNALLFSQPFTVAELDIDMTKEYPITAVRYICAMDLTDQAAEPATQPPAVIIRHKVVESPRAEIAAPPAPAPQRPMSPGRTARYPDFDFDPNVDLEAGPGVHTPPAGLLPPPAPQVPAYTPAAYPGTSPIPPVSPAYTHAAPMPPPPPNHPANYTTHSVPRGRGRPVSPGRAAAERATAHATDGYTVPAFSKEPIMVPTTQDVIRELDRAAHLPATVSLASPAPASSPRLRAGPPDGSPHGSLGEMLTREKQLSLARQELEEGNRELIRLSQERRAVAPEALARLY
eukprot:TRINITY_DN25348_c0_g1_i1.p1 TRINITY_DN25348_c0_g1~~TRINITY_DN25348_c0_g1_i1.p1  ORF type:complete len:797 (+),score=257.81 TRINITY_DN25348_c0_g1_i1:131-2521(+)